MYTNKIRINKFEKSFKQNEIEFYESEIARTEATLDEYKIVLKVIPILIILAALLILFINTPIWRAISITTIAMLVIILLVDGNAHSRIENYNKELKLINNNKN